MESKSTRIYGLDLMRAIAILLVVISHAVSFFPEYNNLITDSLQIIGVQGVEVFFVLSGFLIGRILLKMVLRDGINFKEISSFWVRRWFRTLPLYFLILLINIGIALVVTNNLPDELWKYFLFLQNFDYGYLSFFPESWSLSIEEFAYVIAPITLYFFGELFSNKKSGFLIATSALILFFFCTKFHYYYIHLDDTMNLGIWNSSVKATVLYRLDAVYYGFIFAYLSIVNKEFFKRCRYAFACIGSLLFIAIYGGVIFIFKTEEYPLFWNVIYLPINSLTIGFFLPFLYYFKSFSTKITSWVTKISVYSYAMYLLHYTFILYVMQLIYPYEGLKLYQKMICVLVYLSITYILSSIIYKYYEKPITNLRDKKFFKDLVKSN